MLQGSPVFGSVAANAGTTGLYHSAAAMARGVARSRSISLRTEPKSSSRSTAPMISAMCARTARPSHRCGTCARSARATAGSRTSRADARSATRASRRRRLDLHDRLRAVDRRFGADLDLLGCEAPQVRVVVTRRLELRRGQRAICRIDGGGVMRGKQRLELALVGRRTRRAGRTPLAERDADLAHPRRIGPVLVHEIEQRGVHALDRRRRGPQPQRDLLELPALAEIGGGRLAACRHRRRC